MTAPQSTSAGTNPPQFNALAADTEIVSLQIGGNDIGFTEIIQNCVDLQPVRPPVPEPLRPQRRRRDRARIAATAPKIAAVLEGINARRRHARVLVVNYAAILPETGSGCWPQVPLACADVPYVRGIAEALNTMLATQARRAPARRTSTTTRASLGRDACRSSSVALGRAARARQRGGAVPPQRAR